MTAFLLLAGCSGAPPEKPALELAQDDRSPFALSVLQERYDGKTLAVEVRLISRTYWEPRGVLFEVQTLRAGIEVARYRYRLTDLVGPGQLALIADQNLLSPDSQIDFPVVIPSADATDYQISVAWGDDAKVVEQNFDTPQADVGLANLTVRTVPVLCDLPPCKSKFQVEGQLQNRSPRVVQRVELAISLNVLGAQLDLDQGINQTSPSSTDEERLVIEGAALAPQGGREFRVLLDRELTAAEVRQLAPSVRIVAAQ